MNCFLFFKMAMIMIFIMISVSFLTLLERKILSLTNFRVGPSKVSFFGMLQPLMDAMKISNKQTNVLSNFSFFYYYFSTSLMLCMSFLLWMIYSLESKIIDIKMSVLFFLLIISVHTINSLFSGWSTFSKYSILASLRMVSNMISYETVIFMIFFFFLFFFFSFSFCNMKFNEIMLKFFPLCFLFWILACLAELSRTPFDYSESESELVSGFNIDYGSKFFSFIFLSEYSNILFFSMLTSFIFFFFTFFVLFIFFTFIFFFIIWLRSVLPRLRYDNFMDMCWKFVLPFITLYFIYFIFFSQ